jgi:hypothetical protein
LLARILLYDVEPLSGKKASFLRPVINSAIQPPRLVQFGLMSETEELGQGKSHTLQ